MSDLARELDAAVRDADFVGVVSLSRHENVEFEAAFGPADRAHAVPFAVDTQFATASATKGFTAVAVLALVEDGQLALDTRARVLLGTDLPLIADEVTVELLLTHRSGIGDYVDEDAAEEAPLKVPVQGLDTTEHYLPALDGFPAKFAPGARFSYCNSGYVVLALLAERAAARPFADLVAGRVWQPAGMHDTVFLRSDRLPGRAAIGYLDDGRSNVFALPVLGSGDGGAYSTLLDIRRFWLALMSGRLVPDRVARRMTSPTSTDTGTPFGYGMGFWLDVERGLVMLEGCDHGVSFRSLHEPASGRTLTIANPTTDGAFGVAKSLRALVF